MRAVFFGTPAFAVPTLSALVQAGHEVVAVVAQPDRPAGRGQKLHVPATVERARELGLFVRQPKALKSGPFHDWFTSQAIDVAVVVAYGRILPPAYLSTPRFGCINVHGSLLPKYRGAAPIQWSVIRGEKETGCTTMRLEPGLDTGPVFLSQRTPIGPDETAGELFERLAPIGADLLVQTLAQLPGLEPTPQDHAQATLAPLLDKSTGAIDWALEATAIHDLVRGTNPWPGAFTGFRDQRLKIHRTRVVEGNGAAGTLLEGDRVACGQGALQLVEVQLPGGKRMDGGSFVNGARVGPGEKLVTPFA